MILTENRAKNVGLGLTNISFTDNEIWETMGVLRIVIAFMEGAGYHYLTIGPLRLKLNEFECFARARKVKEN